MTKTTRPAGKLHFKHFDSVSGKFIREMDRIAPDSPWFACLVAGREIQVRLALKSGKVVAFRAL